MRAVSSQAQITCPQCGTSFEAQLHTIVDARRHPHLKDMLLRGRLNFVVCPACGAQGALMVPLAYHDPDHELLIVFIPSELNLPMEEEEKLVGQLTRAVMESVPPEARKGYFLNPKRVITFDSLLEAVLEAEGIDRETLEAAFRRQGERIQLLLQMLDAVEDEQKLADLVRAHGDELDPEFLALLVGMLEAAEEYQDKRTVQGLQRLRERLIELAGIPPERFPKAAHEAMYADLLRLLRQTSPDHLEAVVTRYRPFLDYGFFLYVTEQIEAAGSQDERQELEILRHSLVELTERLDRETHEAVERASKLLNEILRAPDMEAAIVERADQLDEAFLLVLSASIKSASEQNRPDVVEVLQRVYRRTIEEAAKKLRPELQMVNRLLGAETPQERERLLREALTHFDAAGFLEILEMLASDAEAQGAGPELLSRLHDIVEQARAIQDAMHVQ
ncbi:MAG: CpXC domain-containing protein [Ardenticatenia bacterium]|nr:CpXC domain-containing protein [Ardenticatenia bacterium]